LLAEHAASRDNNFDVIRLAAAAMVFVNHCASLTGHGFLGIAGSSFGGLGVSIFFAISGFLVARSWDGDPNAVRYAIKRFLRLWPALALVVIVAALVIGPLATVLPLRAYLADGGGRYVSSNLVLHMRFSLPGVFHSNPSPNLVTGTLWTLPIEAKAYVLVAVLGIVGVLLRPLFVAAVLVVLWWLIAGTVDYQAGPIAGWFVAPVQIHMTMIFTGGVLLYALRERVRLDWRLGALAAAVVLVTPQLPGDMRALTWPLALPYLVAIAAYRTPAGVRRLTRRGDVSYGLYLWGFPVQQALIALHGGTASTLWVLVVAGPVAYFVALASWRIVERPALQLKPRPHGRLARLTASAARR
jgi:peptidoglycan/LPS O-acetylase OafA/YrhL